MIFMKIFARLLAPLLVFIAFAATMLGISAIPAMATTQQVNTNCANLDVTQGGAPLATGIDSQFDITLAVGDRITVSNDDGAFSYQLPGGGGTVNVPASPATIDVQPGQAGEWSFNNPRAPWNASCTVGGALADASDDGLEDQQLSLTPIIMNNQTHNLIQGVGENTESIMNGQGMAPMVDQNGFAFQSTGTAKWLAARNRALQAEHGNSKAFNLFARKQAPQAGLPGKEQGIPSGSQTEAPASIEQRMTSTAVESETVYAADMGASIADLEPLSSPWNFWVKGTWTHYDGHGNSFDGSITNLIGGVDYRVRQDLVVGVVAAYGMARFDTLTGGLVGEFDADGLTVGAYMGQMLSPDLMFDALVAYTASDYDNRRGTTTGSFDAHRVTVAAKLKGNIDWGTMVIMPTLGLMYASEDQDSYTDSAGTSHAARNITAGRISVGPKFIFPQVSTGMGSAQFWFATEGEYNFSNQGSASTPGLPDIDDSVSGRIQAGFNSTADSGASLSLLGDISGLGSSEFIAYGASAKLTVPF